MHYDSVLFILNWVLDIIIVVVLRQASDLIRQIVTHPSEIKKQTRYRMTVSRPLTNVMC